MKKPKLIKEGQIIVLYQYFLLGENNQQFASFLSLNAPTRLNAGSSASDQQEKLSWFDDFKQKKDRIFAFISANLKEGWKIGRIPALEKAIIVSAIYTMQGLEFLQRKYSLLLVNQVLNFSKKYLEKNKYGYINKLLDLVMNKPREGQLSTQGSETENLPV